MTEINFYTGVANPLNATAKLIAKAYAGGKCVRVVTPDAATTERLDRLLWEVPAESFLPHVTLASAHAAMTPVIVDHANTHEGVAEVLINISTEPPPFFSRFERVFEIVGAAEDVAAAGRARWQFYKARGYEMTHTVMKPGVN
jgi:DNA polymerase III subunit chi